MNFKIILLLSILFPHINYGQNISYFRLGVGQEFVKGSTDVNNPRLSYNSNNLTNFKFSFGKLVKIDALRLGAEVGFNYGGYKFKTLSLQNSPSIQRVMKINSFYFKPVVEKDFLMKESNPFLKGSFGIICNWNAFTNWEFEPDKFKNGNKIIKSIDIGIVGGVSFEIYLKKRTGICLDARFYYGLTDISTDPNNKTYKRGLELGVKYLLLPKPLKKKRKKINC